MGNVYTFDGQLYENVEEFLSAVAHEYKSGDQDLALTALDDYGFSLTDIGVRPEGV